MASSSNETALEIENDSNPNLKGSESKKRKFKPFSAVRRLFSGGGGDKGNNRGKSNTATVDGDEENYSPSSPPLVSDDSSPLSAESAEVFRYPSLGDESRENVEQQTHPIVRAQKSALLQNAANLPKSAFQTELTTELTRRRSLCSEEDEEDSLRQEGPAPPVVVTDTSSIEESIKEDLFNSKWSSSVQSASSSTPSTGTADQETRSSLDLGSMTRTELLNSTVAKDRISVKPRTRRPNWGSRKNREKRYSLSMPSLDEVDSSSQSGGRPQSEYVDPRTLSGYDLHTISPPTVELTTEPVVREVGPTTITTSKSPSLQQPPTPSTTTTAASPNSSIIAIGRIDKQGVRLVDNKAIPPPLAYPSGKTQHRVSFAADKAEAEIPPPPVTQVMGSSPSVQQPQKKETGASAVRVSVAQDLKKTVSFPVVIASSREGTASLTPGTPSASVAEESSLPVSVSADVKKEGLRQTDRQSEDAFSPKADYKLRRQQRSKTLPVQQPVVTVQRTASQRGKADLVKKHWENEEESSKRSKPEWFALARSKTLKHGEDSQQQTSSVSADANALVRQSSELRPPTIITITTTKTSAAVSSVPTTQPPPTQSATPPSSVTPIIVTVSSDIAEKGAVNQNQRRGDGGIARRRSLHTATANITILPTRDSGSVKATSTGSTSTFAPAPSTRSLPRNVPASTLSSSLMSVDGAGQQPKTPALYPSVQETRQWKTQITKELPMYVLEGASSTTSFSVLRPTLSSGLPNTAQSSSPSSNHPGGSGTAAQFSSSSSSYLPGGTGTAAQSFSSSSNRPGGTSTAAQSSSSSSNRPGGTSTAAQSSSSSSNRPGGTSTAAQSSSSSSNRPGGTSTAAQSSSSSSNRPGGTSTAAQSFSSSFSSNRPGGTSTAAQSSSYRPGGPGTAAQSSSSSSYRHGGTSTAAQSFSSSSSNRPGGTSTAAQSSLSSSYRPSGPGTSAQSSLSSSYRPGGPGTAAQSSLSSSYRPGGTSTAAQSSSSFTSSTSFTSSSSNLPGGPGTAAKVELRPVSFLLNIPAHRPGPQRQGEKKPLAPVSGAPTWHTELVQRTMDAEDVKIDLIESAPSGRTSTRGTGGKTAASDPATSRPQSVASKVSSDVPSDKCRPSVAAPTQRHSRVMDLLKSFESLQSVI